MLPTLQVALPASPEKSCRSPVPLTYCLQLGFFTSLNYPGCSGSAKSFKAYDQTMFSGGGWFQLIRARLALVGGSNAASLLPPRW